MAYGFLIRVGLTCLTLAFVPLAAWSEDPAPTDVRGRMMKFIQNGELAGAVTVVGSKSGTISYEAMGKLSLDRSEPMPKNAMFRIASMTKPITALGIMMLAEEGKLTPEDPVEKHLPEFRGQMLVAERSKDTVTLKKPARPIAIRDLLTHTSGLPGGPPAGMSDLYLKRNRTLAEAVCAFSQRPLDFEPGSKWSYCNTGIDTLGRVIEVVSGMPYEDFLKQRIFEPLGMTDTTFYPSAEQLKRVVPTYDRKEGKLVAPANSLIGLPPGAKYPIPAGGLYSTGGDLARLYQTLLNGGTLGKKQIIQEKTLAEMTKIQTGNLKAGFTPGMGFGYGFAVVNEPTGVTAMLSPGSYGHGGAFGTQGWLDPKQDLFVILLIQRVGLSNADASPMRQALQEAAVALRKQ